VRLAGALSAVDFTDLDNFASGFPHALFEVHRREAPVYWHAATENTPDGEGFWSVATYAETLAVLKDPVTYSSVTGGSRPFGGTLLQDLAISGQVLNMMDDPRHSHIRAGELRPDASHDHPGGGRPADAGTSAARRGGAG
jgi:cytochrome P450